MDDRSRHCFELVREVRHDLNGPLTSILGNVQMLLEDPALADPEARATLGEIEDDVRRLATMIRRLAEVRQPDDE